jgi:hypothetical protein
VFPVALVVFEQVPGDVNRLFGNDFAYCHWEMHRTPTPADRCRIDALREYAIMDTTPEEGFDDISRLTSFICDTPIATVTLLDLERQWFKSKVGLDSSEGPIEHAFCAHAIQQENVFAVPDACADPRFATNPLVTGTPNIRFYAGAPLITPKGVAIGTLCAIDRKPRGITEDQKQALPLSPPGNDDDGIAAHCHRSRRRPGAEARRRGRGRHPALLAADVRVVPEDSR